MRLLCTLLTFVALYGTSSAVGASEVWTGPRFTFSKVAFADPTLTENQDRITDNVWLTRGGSAGLFNAKTESNYVFDYSPDDTQWAYGTTADISSLSFTNWRAAVGGSPSSSVGQDMVVHLIGDDIYIDIKFLSWGMEPTSGGHFSYERSTPIPEPAVGGLVAVGLMIVGAIGCGRRRRGR